MSDIHDGVVHVKKAAESTADSKKTGALEKNASDQAANAEMAVNQKKINRSVPQLVGKFNSNALLHLPAANASLKMAFSINIAKKIVGALRGVVAAKDSLVSSVVKQTKSIAEGVRTLTKSFVKVLLNASGRLDHLNFEELKQIAATEKLASRGLQPIVPAVGDEVSTGGNLKGRGQYATIHKEFEKDGVVYGKEVVTRIDTISSRKESLDAKKEHLETQLKDPASPPENRKFVEKQIKDVTKELDSLKNSKHTTWVGSNHSRDVLAGNGIEKDRNNMLSCSVNLREQHIDVNHPNGTRSEISMLRYGAIWDPRNGLTSLPELQSLAAENKACQGDFQKIMALNARIDVRLNALNAFQKEYPSDDQQFIISEAKKKLEAFRPGSFSRPEERNEIVQDREKFLRDQTLDPIKLHLKNNIAKMIKDKSGGNVMRMTHIGLLNSEAQVDFQKNGWAHIESNQIADMQAAFRLIDNLKIKVRNEPGTFFDEQKDGSVVMYVSAAEIGWKGNIPSEIKLETCFMNISVQRHTTNDGMQADINRAGIDKLATWITSANLRPEQEKQLTEELNGIRERLEGDQHEKDKTGWEFPLPRGIRERLEGDPRESSFDLAAELALLADKLSAMSQGCLSCKDRGGTVAEMIGIKAMQRVWSRASSTENLKTHDEAFKKFFNEMLDATSPCVKVINDCTGTGIAKVDIRLLKSMDLSVRIAEGFRLAFARVTGGFNVTPETKPQFLPLDDSI